jgi:LysR family transcriptional regulator, hydrogen peroxide-inducible genes activator
MNLAPLPFTLRQLQYVLAVSESLSFRRAAEQCHVSQPALSAQIAEIESLLGVKIFERDRRRVIVTSVGVALIERARTLLVDANDLVETAQRTSDPFSGTLRIGVIPTLSQYLLPEVVTAIRKEYPRLSVQWVENKTHALVESLESGSLEAAILALEADLKTLEHATILRDPFLLAGPVGHALLKRTTPCTLDELKGCTMLLLDEEHCLRAQALSFCGDDHVREAQFRATSLSTLAQMVAGGAGVTLLPQIAVSTETRSGALRVRKFVAPAPYRTVVLAWRKRSPLGPSFQTLAAFLRSVVKAQTTKTSSK